MDTVTKALKGVVEADDAAGAALIGMVVYDYLADRAEALRPDLDRVLGAWALDRVGVAKRQLGRAYVSKAVEGEYPTDDVHQAAEWIAGLEAYVVDAVTVGKDLTFENWARRNVRRDEKGRFARDLAGAGTPNVQARSRNQPDKVAPNVRAMLENWNDLETPVRERMSVHQGQWEQAGEVLAQMSSAFQDMDRSKIDAVLTLRKPSGQIDEIVFPLSAVKGGQLPKNAGFEWDVNEDGLSVSVQAGRGANEALERRIAAFNTLGTVGGTALQRLAEVEPGRWQEFATTLGMPRTETQADQGTLNRFFNQLSAGGRVLSQITGQERMSEWAQFVGSMGPQAEQVLGPYVQRAAYRYRGTEKTPDQSLVRSLQGGPVLEGVTEKLRGRQLEGDSLRMNVQAEIAAAHLLNTLPKDPILRRLSQKSGNVLPSQGVLFDADGNVVSQAVGYADDHYLPFDLKGLGSLRGGHYVRTRMMGGPTAEDIYAAVHTGARMLTVASPSGVYTLEFDPAFRGARAGSDKARQMNDRYIKILDAVKGSGLYLQDIDPVTSNRIAREAATAYPGDDPTSTEMREALVTRRRNQERLKAMSVSDSDVEELQAEARQRLGVAEGTAMRPEVARQYEDVLGELIERKRSENVRALRLNGEGYAVALQTLQQQFPYFLKTPSYQDLATFNRDLNLRPGVDTVRGARQAVDGGYVGPGGLRAETVRRGFYNYQGLDVAPKRRGDDAPTTVTAGGAGSGGAAQPANTTTTTSPGAPATAERATEQPTQSPAQGALVTRLRSNAPIMDRRRDELVVGMMGQIGGIAEEFLAGAGKLADMDTESALKSDPDTLARWFLTRNPREIKDLLTRADTDSGVGNTLLPVLQNRQIVERAFTDVMTGSRLGNVDYFSEGNTVGGKSTLAGAAGWVADSATTVANLSYARDPFIGEIGDREASGKHTGLKPQAFTDLTSITTREAFDRTWADEPALAGVARLLMESPDGEELTIGQTAKVASDRIAALNALEAALPSLRAGDPDALAQQGTTEEDIARVIGVAPNDLIAEAAAMDFDQQRLQTQRAWTLATVGRLLQYLPSKDGGDVDPKGWDPLGRLAGPPEVDKQSLDWRGLIEALNVTGVMVPRALL